MKELIERGLAGWGLEPCKAESLARYGAMLLEWNQSMNLTAITDPQEVATLHMLDCAALAAHWPLRGSLIDVGTGAGFPGMVLAILCPQLQVTLLEPLEKRLAFLGKVAETLGLDNVTLLHGRAEDLGRDPAFRETFTFATARAVAELTVLSELCLPFLAPGGRFLAMKSTDSGPELEGARAMIVTLGGEAGDGWDYQIPGTNIVHRVYPIEKVFPTPAAYPRRWAKISRKKG